MQVSLFFFFFKQLSSSAAGQVSSKVLKEKTHWDRKDVTLKLFWVLFFSGEMSVVFFLFVCFCFYFTISRKYKVSAKHS